VSGDTFGDDAEDWAELTNSDAPREDDMPDPARTLNIGPDQLGWDEQTRELAWLLAIAIERLGGALVISDAERRRRGPHYTLGWDVKFTNDTQGIRIFSVLQSEEEAHGGASE